MLNHDTAVTRDGLFDWLERQHALSYPDPDPAPQESFEGGSGDDTHIGTASADTLNGNGGNDLLSGGAGSDTINGGDGDDALASYLADAYLNQYPFSSSASLDIYADHDVINGGAGEDKIAIGYGDTVDGGADNDRLYVNLQGAPSGVTADFTQLYGNGSVTIGGGTITGIESVNSVIGSEFGDTLRAFGNGYNFDSIWGMGGNDTLTADYYTQVMDGGTGNDIVDGRGSQYLQDVIGGDGDDTLYTNTNTFAAAHGGDGNDTIYSHGETHGGAGNDVIWLQNSYYGGRVYGEDGNDQIHASDNGNFMSGGAGADIITGSNATDVLISGDFDASGTTGIDNGTEHDVLNGLGGDDEITAGYGDDVDGGSGTNRLTLFLSGASSGITLSAGGFATGTGLTIGGGTIKNMQVVRTIVGTNFADNLYVEQTASAVLVGGGGDDALTLAGSGGGDIFGEAGNDVLYSNTADTHFHGGSGADIIHAGSGNDIIYFDSAGDFLAGEQIDGGAGTDTLLMAVDGNITGATWTHIEKIMGASPSTVITLTTGQLVSVPALSGTFVLSNGGAVSLSGIDIGESSFRLSASGNTFDLTGALGTGGTAGVTVVGNASRDVVTATGGADLLQGAGGNDTLRGAGGNDTLQGGAGDDLLEGGAGNDNMSGGADNDTYVVNDAGDIVTEFANEGTDTVLTTLASYTLGSNVEKLTFTGSGAFTGTGNGDANVITGGDSNDTLYGMGGDDTLIGGGGADTLVGGQGNDTYILSTGVNPPNDIITELAGEGVDTVSTGLGSYTLGDNLENLVFTGASPFSGIGNELANTITGGGGTDTLQGLGGNDTLNGGDGDDLLIGGAGVDTVNGGAGDDRFWIDESGVSAGDHFSGGTGFDTLEIITHTPQTIDLTGVIIDSDVEALSSLSSVTTITTAQLNGFQKVQGQLAFAQAGSFDLSGNKGLGGTIALAAGTNMVTLAGNSAAYTIDGNTGADTMIGSEGNDTLRGWDGNDVLEGRGGNDKLGGGDGDDTIRGGDGDDVVFGNGGNNLLEGGAGDDWIRIDTNAIGGTSFASGGSGNDLLSFNTNGGYGVPVNIDIPNIANDFERLDAQGVNVSMSAAQFVNFTSILGSTVKITTGGDLGTLGALDDFQTLVFSDLGNTLTITSLTGLHVQSITGGTGTDMINLTLTAPGAFTLGAGIENLHASGAAVNIFGNELDNYVTGTDGNDVLVGGDGDDTLDGGPGADTLVGGKGNDHYFVDQQGDVVYENPNEGTDTVTSTSNYYLYANIEKLELAAGAGDIFGVGNDLNNTIAGNEGANLILGGAGNDTIHGGAGNDQVYGEGGNDTLYGDAGTDYLIGGDGDDVLDGGLDADGLYGQDGNDILYGGTDFKTDIMVGGNGDDIIHADSGLGDYDQLDGGSGNDTYYVDTYADVTYEAAGGGTDTVYANISGGGYYLYANVENLYLLGDTTYGVGNDLRNEMYGSDSANTLLGGGGNDHILAAGGNDTLYGEAGDDMLEGEAGDDGISGGDGADNILGGDGNDTLYGDAGNDTIDGGRGYDIISGGAGDDTLYAGPSTGPVDGNYISGDDGNDVIYLTGSFRDDVVLGGAGDDIIYAGNSSDTLTGGADNDTYYLEVVYYIDGTGRHEFHATVAEDAGGGNDTVHVSGDSSVTYYMDANVENLIMDTRLQAAVGNDIANTITGTNFNDTLLGGAGDDVLNGKVSNDTLWGEAGADHFVFEQGTGQDTVGDFTAGTDKIDLSSYHFSTYADVQARLHETGGTTTIDLGNGDSVVLTGVAMASLHEGDFILSGGSAAVVPMAQLAHTPAANDADFTEARSALIDQLDVPHLSVVFGAL